MIRRVRWAVRVGTGELARGHGWLAYQDGNDVIRGKGGRRLMLSPRYAHNKAKEYGGVVVRVTMYETEETAARRTLIEAARFADGICDGDRIDGVIKIIEEIKIAARALRLVEKRRGGVRWLTT